MNNLPNNEVVEASDAYLDAHRHTEAAYEHVRHTLDKYSFAVDLARSRALGELALLAKVIPFPRAYEQMDVLQAENPEQ